MLTAGSAWLEGSRSSLSFLRKLVGGREWSFPVRMLLWPANVISTWRTSGSSVTIFVGLPFHGSPGVACTANATLPNMVNSSPMSENTSHFVSQSVSRENRPSVCFGLKSCLGRVFFSLWCTVLAYSTGIVLYDVRSYGTNCGS